MRAEAAWLISLARGDLAGDPCRPIDAEEVAQLAVAHQVDALCYWMWRNIVAPSGLSLPPRLEAVVERGFRERYIHHSLRNRSLLVDVRAVNDALRAAGVRAMYAKGPWVAFCAYPDPGTRPVEDIDLCIDEGDYLGAVDALRSIGYEPEQPPPRTATRALDRAHYGGQLRFSARGRRRLELHFRLINIGPPTDEGWIRRTARDLEVQGTRLLVPGPEAMLLHLSLHANQHAFALLRLFHDIRWAVERNPTAPASDEFVAGVRHFRCRASTFHALLISRELAGAGIGDADLSRLRPARSRSAAFRLLWRVHSVRRLDASLMKNRRESPLLYLLEMGRLRDKIRYCGSVLAEALRGREADREPATTPVSANAGGAGDRPKLREDLLSGFFDDQTALYDPVRDRTTVLNDTARRILDLCDGTRTVGAMASELARIYQADEMQIRTDIGESLRELVARNLMIDVSSA